MVPRCTAMLELIANVVRLPSTKDVGRYDCHWSYPRTRCVPQRTRISRLTTVFEPPIKLTGTVVFLALVLDALITPESRMIERRNIRENNRCHTHGSSISVEVVHVWVLSKPSRNTDHSFVMALKVNAPAAGRNETTEDRGRGWTTSGGETAQQHQKTWSIQSLEVSCVSVQLRPHGTRTGAGFRVVYECVARADSHLCEPGHLPFQLMRT
jgi:hypothetical protein